MEVHNEQGRGFLEPVYQECKEIELGLRGLHFDDECWTKIYYKGHTLKKEYKCDFVCCHSVLIEIKGVKQLLPEHVAQTINYLKATKLKRVLLISLGRNALSSNESSWTTEV